MPLSVFPESVRSAVALFDQDGSGDISAEELGEAAQMLVDSRDKAKRLQRLLIGVAVAGVVILVAMVRGAGRLPRALVRHWP